MTARFLNERLITTSRFAPGSAAATRTEPDQAAGPERHDDVVTELAPAPPETGAAAAAPATEVVPPETSNAIDRWLRVEDETARGVVLRQEVAELNRLRREVQTELDRALATLTRQRDQAARQVTELSQVCEGLGAVPAALPDGVTSAEFRQARHVIQGVRMELLKHQRATTSAEGRPPPAFYSLSFGQLTRLGLGLTWPLLVMLLLVGLMIAFGVVLAFRV